MLPISYTILCLSVIAILAKFKAIAPWFGLIDIPNHRSSHVQATPRAGGMVFMLAWVLWMLFAAYQQLIPWHLTAILLPSIMLISIIGLIDDRYSIAAKWRFLAQCCATALLLWQLPIGIFIAVIAALALIWSTNLFNFMDGIDGIAAIEALTVFGFGGIIFWAHGALALSWVSWSLCAGCAGFLVWNLPPAKIFMGDVGSTSLGFLVIALPLIGLQQYHISPVPWFILYSAFLTDASATLIRRLFAGEKWYQAHKSHAYQRLHQAGFSHAQVLFFLMGLNAILIYLANLALDKPQYQWLICAGALFLNLTAYKCVKGVSPPRV